VIITWVKNSGYDLSYQNKETYNYIIYIPAVHIWQDECGAQAIPLTHALWLFNLATGVQGTLTSNIITFRQKIQF